MAQMASLTLVMDLVTFCSSYCSSCCFIPAVSKWASWFLLRSDHSPLPESGARGLCVQMSWHLSSVSCVHRSRVIGPYTWPGWGCIFFSLSYLGSWFSTGLLLISFFPYSYLELHSSPKHQGFLYPCLGNKFPPLISTKSRCFSLLPVLTGLPSIL